jgi:branched-chain amino acid transport system substrate-binding protein
MNKKGILLLIIAIILLISGYVIFKNRLIETKKENIKIGVVMPQTGFLANPGKNVIKGIELYFDEFNKENPNHQVELIIEDSKSEPKTGVNALNKLISVDKVKIVIGDLGSPIFLAMAPIAENNKIVMISPGASNPKVRDAGDYIFRDYTSDEFDGKVMANFMYKDRNITECAVLFFNNDYGVGLKEAFIHDFIKNRGQIKMNEAFDDNNLYFKNLVLKLRNSNVKSVYFIGSPKQDAYFLKNLKEMNLQINVFGTLGFEDKEFINIAKGNFDSVIYSTPNFDANSSDSNVVNFVKHFKNKYNELPDLTSALGYDVSNILGYCLKTSNYNINKIKDELYKVKYFNGLTGNTSFDDKGDVEKDVLIKEIKGNGDIIKVKIFKN